MAKPKRSNDWGFPRWRAYGAARDAEPVRHCDRHGCEEPGDRPAPKSPNSPERWYFCERHAAEYNRGWNYFEGLSAEDAAARESDEQRDASAFRQANHYGWGGPGDGTRSRDEMRALDVLEVEPDAGFEEIRAAWRRLAKAIPAKAEISGQKVAGCSTIGQVRPAPQAAAMPGGHGDLPNPGFRRDDGLLGPHSVNMNVPVTFATGSSESPSCAIPRTKPTLRVVP